MSLLSSLAANSERLLKGVLFDCRGCGQCVLRKTGLVCPMRCPKGLRNGPCGGTTGGRCEVLPDRRCIHLRIDAARRRDGALTAPPLLPAPDQALLGTASVANLINGKDAPARRALAPLGLSDHALGREPLTASGLERTLRSGRFAFTTEVRTPRSPRLDRLGREAAGLAGHFDAVNATAFLNGRPALPSSLAAAELGRHGVEAIAQAAGRDHTRTSFLGEAMVNHLNGVPNLLCVTGDWYQRAPDGPVTRQVFDLDAALMLYEARHLRERGTVAFTGEEVAPCPRPFLGCAINPDTDPVDAPVRRLMQKADAGAEFVQTQVVTDLGRLAAFMARYRDAGLDRRLFLLAGIPVITGHRALAMLGHVPGVRLAPALQQRLAGTGDGLRAAGVALAVEMVRAAAAIPGVRGVHLMLFGADHGALTEVRRACSDLAPIATSTAA
ncbi:MAG: methylenetetrahydrofolate reductase C-terminal domain-containing protein [Planctomycetes bacterium]|nr:methylenetetrahydrofolate reductase C-terminal domain-containing protein [Planctomycetota bacterium]